MCKKIKWAVLGSGGIAQRRTIPEGIIPAQNSELVAVCDFNQEINSEIAKKYKVQAVDSLDELLKIKCDVVYIATPVDLHCQQVIACAKAGKHILCEKTLGLNVGEVEKMIAACNHKEVLLGTALMMRFAAQHQVALKMIQEGVLGKLTYGRAQLSCWYPPIQGAFRQDPNRGGGGSLMDMGSHCIDLLEMFFGKVERVSCFVNNRVHEYPVEDSAVATLWFENGAMGTVDSFFCIPDKSIKNRLELYGSKGSILAQGTIGQDAAGEMRAYLESDDSGYNASQVRSQMGGVDISPPPVNTYCAEIEEFAKAIIEGREPSNNAVIGLQSQKVLEACYESARLQKVIEID